MLENNNYDSYNVNGCEYKNPQEVYLFDPVSLKTLNSSEAKLKYNLQISLDEPGDGFQIRPLSLADYDKGFIPLLSQLTSVGDVSREEFQSGRFFNMKNCRDSYYVVVVEDLNKSRIAGSATLVVEQKFIHNTGTRGRIEDVVVSDDYRGKQLGKLLVGVLTLLGQQIGCYKMSLECKDKLISFYETFGFKVDAGNNYLVQRYDK